MQRDWNIPYRPCGEWRRWGAHRHSRRGSVLLLSILRGFRVIARIASYVFGLYAAEREFMRSIRLHRDDVSHAWHCPCAQIALRDSKMRYTGIHLHLGRIPPSLTQCAMLRRNHQCGSMARCSVLWTIVASPSRLLVKRRVLTLSRVLGSHTEVAAQLHCTFLRRPLVPGIDITNHGSAGGTLSDGFHRAIGSYQCSPHGLA